MPLDRRTLIIAGLGLATRRPALAAPPPGGKLRFAVFRNGQRIGEHQVVFARTAGAMTVTAEARMAVKIGPVTVFRYTHRAVEQWTGDRFDAASTRTNSNGKLETVDVQRAPGGMIIETRAGRTTAPAGIAPLSHWNAAVLDGPLFNPQTGKVLKVSATRLGADNGATHWRLRGETEIDDWYDAAGAWLSLRGVLKDRSVMEYRRA